MTIDVARLVGAVTREISTRELHGKLARVLMASRTYDTTVEELWDALTNAERIPRWFLPVSGDLRLGGRYQLEGNASGEVTLCEPPRHLTVTWEFGGDVSWVDVQLEESVGSAVLRLEHIAHISEEFWNQYGPGATGVGWEQAFLGLELHVAEVGVALEPKDVQAWLSSEEGAALVRQCSEAWCLASIAAGTDASAARASAQRTTEFYSG